MLALMADREQTRTLLRAKIVQIERNTKFWSSEYKECCILFVESRQNSVKSNKFEYFRNALESGLV